MKRHYIKPTIEIFRYSPEEGFAVSIGLHKDFALIEGDNRDILRSADEVTEYTDNSGQYTIGEWE